MSDLVLEINQIHFKYQKELILKDISFNLKKGDLLGIIGPNGGGKSTLLKLIAGILNPTQGNINRPSKGMAYIPQKDQLVQQIPMTIEDFLKLSRLPMDLCQRREIEEALSKVDLKKPLETDLSELSGGEYQRVLLAKAYLAKVQLIIMDEPTKGLDGKGQDKLLELLKELTQVQNAGVVLVDHNIGQVLKHCDRILCLNKSFHWHDTANMVDSKVLEATYQCEFEHILIHEHGGDILHHHHHHENEPCEHDHKKKDQS